MGRPHFSLRLALCPRCYATPVPLPLPLPVPYLSLSLSLSLPLGLGLGLRLRLLIRLGLEFHPPFTPTLPAAQSGRLKMAKMLVKRGANVNAQNEAQYM